MSTNEQVLLDELLARTKAKEAVDESEAEFFEWFVMERELHEYDLSSEEVESGLVDGGGDGGIDGFFVFLNGTLVQEDTDYTAIRRNVSLEVVILQATRAESFSEARVLAVGATAQDIFSLATPLESLQEKYNQRLLQQARTFREAWTRLAERFPDLGIRYTYCSRGTEVHPNVQSQLDSLAAKLHQLFPTATVVAEAHGASELLALARKRKKTALELRVSEILASSAEGGGFVALVKLSDLFGFIAADNKNLSRGLFEANVRDYEGDVAVNRAIRETLVENGPEDFWWLNNGITILASRAFFTGGRVTIEEPQIVNGLQTTTEIYLYLRELPDPGVEKRQVLVRVIASGNTSSRDRIIEATNRQTLVPPAQLWSSRPIHKNIEEFLRDRSRFYFYERRKNFYRNRELPVFRIVSIAQLAQAVLAVCFQEPNTARARPSTLLRDEGDHDRLFSSDYPLILYFNAVELIKRVDIWLRGVEPSIERGDQNNIKFHVAMVLAAILAGKEKPKPSEIAALRIAGLFSKEAEFPEDEVIHEAADIVWAEYLRQGGSDQAAKGPSLVEALQETLRDRFATRPATETQQLRIFE